MQPVVSESDMLTCWQDNFQFVDATAIMREMRNAPREHREAYFALRALMEVSPLTAIIHSRSILG